MKTRQPPAAFSVDRNVGILLCQLLAPSIGKVRRAPAPAPAPEEVARIAVLKLAGLGSLVLASPTLASLRARFPRAQITFITLLANRRLLETNIDVDEVYYLDTSSPCATAAGFWRLFRHLCRGGYDLVVDLEPSSRCTALLSFLSGIPLRAGFDTPGHARGQLFNLPVPYEEHIHLVEAFHRLAERLGAPAVGRLQLTPIHYPLADEAVVESFALQQHLAPERPLVAIHLGADDGPAGPRWPTERFAQLADALIAEYGVQVVFTGSAKETPLAAEALRAMHHEAVDASGHLNIPQLASLMARCALVISCDAGPLHIAAAMRTPALGLYGPTAPEKEGPWGEHCTTLYHRLPCSPCSSHACGKPSRCPHGDCLRSITVPEVLGAIRARYASLLRPERILAASTPAK